MFNVRRYFSLLLVPVTSHSNLGDATRGLVNRPIDSNGGEWLCSGCVRKSLVET